MGASGRRTKKETTSSHAAEGPGPEACGHVHVPGLLPCLILRGLEEKAQVPRMSPIAM